MEKQKPNIISQISLVFIKRYRITILLAIVLLGLGFFTYSNLLKREGFPVINIPVLLIQTPYLSGDKTKTETDVTSKIYEKLKSIEEIKSISTTSTENFSSVVVNLEENADSELVAKEVEDEINSIQSFTNTISPNIIIPNASRVDGINDMIFSIYSANKSDRELQQLGDTFVAELEKSNLIGNASIISQYESRLDFRTGQQTEINTRFSRVGIKEGDDFNFYTALNIGVEKKSAEIGSIELSKEVRTILKQTKDSNNELESINFAYGGDIAVGLQSQITSLEDNAVAAILTIIVVLFLFLNLRSSLILGFFIPLTLGAVFITFYLIGYSLNTISLFALILVLGLFVDDGTVIVESIDYYKRKGLRGKEAVINAINDIGLADISGTMTTLLVFVPLVFISGILGDFIRLLPITVIVSLALSLIIALTILPFISSVFIPNKQKERTNKVSKTINLVLNFVPNLILKLGESVGKFVSFTLSKRIYTLITIVVSLVIIGLGSSFAARLGFEFFAQSKDAESISINISIPENRDVSIAKDKSIRLEKIIIAEYKGEIENIDYLGGSASSVNMDVMLTPIADRGPTAITIADRINNLAKQIEGASINASSTVAGPPVEQFPFSMQIFSNSQNELANSTEKIRNFIKETKLNNNVTFEEIQVQNLNTIATIDGKRYAQVRVKFEGKSDSATLLELQSKINEKFTQDYLKSEDIENIELGFDFGQESDNAESFNSVIYAGVIALIIMYALLVLQFNSFSQPFLVLLAIPLSFPGLFTGLYLTQNPMSFFVVIGLTGLIGIVVNNTIMLMEYANSRRRAGLTVKESISQAVALRFRAILATSCTTIAGLLPLALTEPFWEPLAFTIIFGLISSVILVLFAFPAYYAVFEKARSSRDRFFERIMK